MAKLKSFLLLMFLTVILGNASWAVQLGTAAPDFTLPGEDGENYTLSKFKGKFVVLEWYNQGCPFVRKHYDSANMQNLQKKYKSDKGELVWLMINSSAPGKQGYLKDDKSAKEQMMKEKVQADHLLLDPEGKVGQLYDAKTTPHMYIVSPKGVLVYQGAIDSIASTDISDINLAKNYVDQSLAKNYLSKQEYLFQTKPYGCSVKYK